MRLDFTPMLTARALNRVFDDAIILGAARVGEDDQSGRRDAQRTSRARALWG